MNKNNFLIIEDILHRAISLSEQIKNIGKDNPDLRIGNITILYFCDVMDADTLLHKMRKKYDFEKEKIIVVNALDLYGVINMYMSRDNNCFMISDYRLGVYGANVHPAESLEIRYARMHTDYVIDDRIWIYTGRGPENEKIIEYHTNNHRIGMISCFNDELRLNLLGNQRLIDRLMNEEDALEDRLYCAYCRTEINKLKEGYVTCLDNFLQQKYFDDPDGKDNIFCSKECACKAMSIKHIYPEIDQDIGF